MVPKDVHMLVSFLNAKLRDDDMTLDHLCEINDCCKDDIMLKLHLNNFYFDEKINQIKSR